MRAGIALGIAICVVVMGARAQAADPLEEGKKEFAAGKAAFERGDYDAALQHFERANLIAPAPTLLYNIGTTYERLGRYGDAALAFEGYLGQVEPPRNDEERTFQENLRARAQADRARAPTTPPPGAPPADGPPPAGYPPPAAGYPPPGTGYPPYTPPQPYVTPPLTPELKLKKAKGHRTNAIVLMAIGVPLNVIGIGLLAVGVGRPWDGDLLNVVNISEIFFGVTGIVVGATLWAPGVASFVKHDRMIRDLSTPEPAKADPAQTFLFRTPVVRF